MHGGSFFTDMKIQILSFSIFKRLLDRANFYFCAEKKFVKSMGVKNFNLLGPFKPGFKTSVKYCSLTEKMAVLLAYESLNLLLEKRVKARD